NAADCDVVPRAKWIERNEHLDLVFVRSLLKQIFHAAQIARPFFSNIADEENVTRSLDLGGIHSTNHHKQNSQSPRVVADAGGSQFCAVPADFEICSFREHGIEMGGNRN